jgi:hypothetical protein
VGRPSHRGLGAAARIGGDEGSAAARRMHPSSRVRRDGREVRRRQEFPELHGKEHGPLVRGGEKPGWEHVAETRRRAACEHA